MRKTVIPRLELESQAHDVDQKHSDGVKDIMYYLNWSYVIESDKGKENDQEKLTDLDNIAINQYFVCFIISKSAGIMLSPFIHLEEFIVDVEKMLVYKYGFGTQSTDLKLVCTDKNDRRRAQRTQRRDLNLEFIHGELELIKNDKFAAGAGEYGKLWI